MKLFNSLFNRLFLLVIFSIGLQGCGDESTSDVDFSSWEKSYLVYSFPFNTQDNVSAKSNIILSFTHGIEDPDMQNHVQVFRILTDADDVPVAGIVSQQDETPETVNFTPLENFNEGDHYRIDYTGLVTEFGEVEDVRDIQFSIFSARDPSVEEGVEAEFSVVAEHPVAELPFMDFSSIRLTFSHSIDRNSIVINDTFSLKEEGNDTSIAGDIFISGRVITFDPKDDLNPASSYVLSLTEGIKSESGLALTVADYENKVYTALSSLPRTTLVQQITDSNAGQILSPLSGEVINSVPLKTILIGEDDATYVGGDLFAELAFIPNFPNASPLVLRKGTVMSGSAIEVKIGGHVPAGFNTGAINMTLVSDGHGYLINNTSTDDKNAPKQVHLLLDVAMTAEGSLANGTMSQDILHLELFGWAKTANDVMVIDAIGEVTPRILGLEDASATVSFHLEAYADQNNAPSMPVDSISPELQSWVPADNAGYMNLSEPLLLTFNEPLANSSLINAISLQANGSDQVISVHQDGSVLIIQPQTILAHNTQYQLSLLETITDIAGNRIDPLELSFTTPLVNTGESVKAAALIESAYPGYNCLLTGENVANGISGRCANGKGDDDLFSLFELPANRNIEVTFNQPMKLDSMVLGNTCTTGTVRIAKVDDSGNCIETVPGLLKRTATGLSFTPNAIWQDGQKYRYSLVSAVHDGCDDNTVICSQENLPLNTDPLKLTSENRQEGGDTFSIVFSGIAAENDYVLNPLAKIPTTDTNKNFAFDGDESGIVKNSGILRIDGFSGLVSGAEMGCRAADEPCDDKKKIYISGLLPTDVGRWDEDNQHIEVKIYPQALMSTSALMYAKLPIIGWKEEPTGPQIMRVRYSVDGQPPKGYITENAQGQATFSTVLTVYLDAPELNPLSLGTNLHSLPLTMNLTGPVTFLADGRMDVQLANIDPVDIDVKIGGVAAGVSLKIDTGALSLNLVSRLIK